MGIDKLQEKVITVFSYMPSFSLTLTGWTVNEWLSVIGILLAIGTFWVNLHFKKKADNREERRLQHEMENPRNG